MQGMLQRDPEGEWVFVKMETLRMQGKLNIAKTFRLRFVATALLRVTRPPAPALQKVNFAHATLSPRLAPLWVAQEQGIFAKYGIGAEVVLVRNGAGIDRGDRIRRHSNGFHRRRHGVGRGGERRRHRHLSPTSPAARRWNWWRGQRSKTPSRFEGQAFRHSKFWRHAVVVHHDGARTIWGWSRHGTKFSLQVVGDDSVLARASRPAPSTPRR